MLRGPGVIVGISGRDKSAADRAAAYRYFFHFFSPWGSFRSPVETLPSGALNTAGEHSSSLKMQVRSGLTGTITGEKLTFWLTGNAKKWQDGTAFVAQPIDLPVCDLLLIGRRRHFGRKSGLNATLLFRPVTAGPE
jgi:hypothetical protein